MTKRKHHCRHFATIANPAGTLLRGRCPKAAAVGYRVCYVTGIEVCGSAPGRDRAARILPQAGLRIGLSIGLCCGISVPSPGNAAGSAKASPSPAVGYPPPSGGIRPLALLQILLLPFFGGQAPSEDGRFPFEYRSTGRRGVFDGFHAPLLGGVEFGLVVEYGGEKTRLYRG